MRYFSGEEDSDVGMRLGEVPCWIFGEHREVEVLLRGEPKPESTE